MNIEKYVSDFKNNNDIDKIRESLKNVYFIIGTAYAGKSTMIKMLAENFNGVCCEENWGLNFLEKYNVKPETYPNLCYTKTHTMIDFVNRTPDDYYNWLRNSEIEITPIEINELIELAILHPDKPIFVDTSIPMEILKEISDYNHVAVMLSEQSMSVNRFFDREDYEKQIILRAIKNSDNPDLTMENYRKGLEKANSKERYNYFLNSGFYVFKRNDLLSLEDTMNILANHFKVKKNNYGKGVM